MPDSNGKFRGIQVPEDAWTRVFGPALADDPAPDGDESSVDWAIEHGSGGEPSTPEEDAHPTPPVPSEPPHEVPGNAERLSRWWDSMR